MLKKRIVIVDYGSGNLRSVAAALRCLGEAPLVTSSGDAIAAADRIILPGVGAFAGCVRALDGLCEPLREAVLQRGVPFLGICVGMQLMAERGLEHGVHAGFGWIPGEVVRVPGKTPRMGWAAVAGEHFYFAHSYHFVTDYIEQRSDGLAAVVRKDNLLGVQFHPEKSHASGLRFLRKFLAS